MVLALFVTVLAAYLLGSVPTGYLVGRAKGIDLRQLGSGNIGATNALRILGRPAGIFVLVVDALKGFLGGTLVPVAIARLLPAATGGETNAVHLAVAGGIGAVLGHNFTCWLRFKGGKGIATSAGVLAGVLPWPFLAALVAFLAALATTRVVSLGSLAAATVLPAATWYWHETTSLRAFSFALAALAIWRHRANIRRLLAGTEPRMGQRRPESAHAPCPPDNLPT